VALTHVSGTSDRQITQFSSLSLLIVVGAILWPLVLGSALWEQVRASRTNQRGGNWAGLVYLAGSRICHQRPERSFATQSVQWPVCARCSGLYMAAPFGALVGWRWRKRRTMRAVRNALAAAAIPTAFTLVAEWSGALSMTNGWRFAAALPLGAVIATALVVAGSAESIE
jgi:uncharacterized membrane protein